MQLEFEILAGDCFCKMLRLRGFGRVQNMPLIIMVSPERQQVVNLRDASI